jgi:hypothetical protein
LPSKKALESLPHPAHKSPVQGLRLDPHFGFGEVSAESQYFSDYSAEMP